MAVATAVDTTIPRDYTKLRKQGIFYFSKPVNITGETAFLFPGHGSQYANMLYKLRLKEPVVKLVFDEADAGYAEVTGRTLTERMFPTGIHAESQSKKMIHTPEVMQPAIFTTNIAMFRLLEGKGFKAEYHIGHSLGELAAWAASGAFSIEDGVKAAFYRAMALKQIPKENCGGMMSISLHPENHHFRTILNISTGYAVKTLHNSPEQTIVSGTMDALEKIEVNCKTLGVRCTRLNVSHAFHCDLMQSAAEYFRHKLKYVTFKPPSIPIISTIDEKYYTKSNFNPAMMAEFLSTQFVTGFSFCNIISKLYDEKQIRNFVEIGPKSILTGLVENILKGNEFCAVASNIPSMGDEQSLSRLITCLNINHSKKEETEMSKGLAITSTINIPSNIAVSHNNFLDEFIKLALSDYSEINITQRNNELEITINGSNHNRIHYEPSLEPADQTLVIAKDRDESSDELESAVTALNSMDAPLPFSETIVDKPTLTTDLANSTSTEISNVVYSVFMEVTGYPKEMLEPQFDLEADLGIDSVKQAEILGIIGQRFNISPDTNINSKELNTIKTIIDWLRNHGATSQEFFPQTKSAEMPAMTSSEVDKPTLTTDLANSTSTEISNVVYSVFMEVTGYPKEMLEPQFDLEADLGIDSVKQAEILGIIGQRFNISPDTNINSKELNTIKTIIDWLRNHGATSQEFFPQTKSAEMPAMTSSEVDMPLSYKDETEILDKVKRLHKNNSVTRRYVSITVEKELDPSDEIYSFQGKSFIVIEDGAGGNITSELITILRKKNARCILLREQGENREPVETISDFYNVENLKSSFHKAKKELGQVDGIINLYPISSSFSIFDTTATGFNHVIESNFKLLFYGVKSVYDEWQDRKNPPALFCASNIGGVFAYETEISNNPTGGLCSGFLKSLKKELPDIVVKIVDFSNIMDAAMVAELMYQEFSHIELPLEIGYTMLNRRKVIQVIPRPIEEVSNGLPTLLGSNDLIVFSGGGRGIMFECARGIAKVFGSRIVVTGRTPLPEGQEPWLKMSEKEFKEFKIPFMIQKRTEYSGITLLALEGKYNKLAHARELYQNMRFCCEKGLNVYYERYDLSKIEEASRFFKLVSNKYGKITGVVHGAGLFSSGLISKKSEQHTLNVVRTKCDTFYNIYQNVVNSHPLKFFMFFGSILGRYGMDGQADYTAGASIMVTLSQLLNYKHPEFKSFTLGWTAWGEIGMAAAEQVRRIQEGRGLTYLSPSEGVQKFLLEIMYGGYDQEVIIAGKIGTNSPMGHNDLLNEDYTKVAKEVSNTSIILNRDKYPMLQEVVSQKNAAEVVLSKDIHIEEDRYLLCHKLDQLPVLPGFLQIEAYGETVRFMESSDPDTKTVCYAIKDISFEKFIKYYPSRFLTLRYHGSLVKRKKNKREYQVEIRSDFINPKGVVLEKDRLHSRGTVVCMDRFPPEPASWIEVDKVLSQGRRVDLDKFYQLTDSFISFGPTFRDTEKVWYINEHEIAGLHRVPSDNQLFTYTTSPNFLLSPTLFDNAGRIALMLEFHNNGYVLVPIYFDEMFMFGKMPGRGAKLYSYGRFIEIEDDLLRFDMQLLYGESKRVYLQVKGALMRRMGKVDGEHDIVL